jgi:hypothetical protein
MSMEEVLDSVRRMITRWTVTNSPLVADAAAGDIVINVNATTRFKEGDEVMIRTPLSAETPLYIDSVIDTTHIQLTTPIQINWAVSDGAILEKTFYQKFIQNVYLGEPENIPKFPAITIKADTSNSEWLTLRSTKEAYNLSIGVYVQSSNQEDTYRYLLRVTDTIQWGLKHHIFPLVGPYTTTAVTADIDAGDIYVKVADSSIFDVDQKHRAILEDPYNSEDMMVLEIPDSTTVKLSKTICFDYLTSSGTKLINVTRFIYNSWPSDIEYGTIFKGTLLKAATISWFAWEEEIQRHAPMTPNIT